MTITQNWRNDPGLDSEIIYKKRFALFPVICTGDVKVWFKIYYKKYAIWGHKNGKIFNNDDEYRHVDFIENITEEDYLVRKLAKTL